MVKLTTIQPASDPNLSSPPIEGEFNSRAPYIPIARPTTLKDPRTSAFSNTNYTFPLSPPGYSDVGGFTATPATTCANSPSHFTYSLQSYSGNSSSTSIYTNTSTNTSISGSIGGSTSGSISGQPASPASVVSNHNYSLATRATTTNNNNDQHHKLMRSNSRGVDAGAGPAYMAKTVPIKLPDASIKEIPADRVVLTSWLAYMQREYHILDKELIEANRRANLPPPIHHTNPIGYYMANEKTLTQLKVQFTRICNNIALLQEVLASLPYE